MKQTNKQANKPIYDYLRVSIDSLPRLHGALAGKHVYDFPATNVK